jgi:hypothetical protein
MYRLSKAAGTNTQHVIRLLAIANNAKSLHEDKLARTFHIPIRDVLI